MTDEAISIQIKMYSEYLDSDDFVTVRVDEYVGLLKEIERLRASESGNLHGEEQ